MKEIRKGNKAVRLLAGCVFYGQYCGHLNQNEFQVLDTNDNGTNRTFNNMVKKYL